METQEQREEEEEARSAFRPSDGASKRQDAEAAVGGWVGVGRVWNGSGESGGQSAEGKKTKTQQRIPALHKQGKQTFPPKRKRTMVKSNTITQPNAKLLC